MNGNIFPSHIQLSNFFLYVCCLYHQIHFFLQKECSGVPKDSQFFTKEIILGISINIYCRKTALKHQKKLIKKL